jgi:hypothetical protein
MQGVLQAPGQGKGTRQGGPVACWASWRRCICCRSGTIIVHFNTLCHASYVLQLLCSQVCGMHQGRTAHVQAAYLQIGRDCKLLRPSGIWSAHMDRKTGETSALASLLLRPAEPCRGVWRL